MIPLAQTVFAVVAMISALLMVTSGVGRKQLRWRTVRCPVCHHPRSGCTCRWR